KSQGLQEVPFGPSALSLMMIQSRSAPAENIHEPEAIDMGGIRSSRIALVIVGIAVGFAPVFVYHAAEPRAPEWKLVWSDEFDGKEIDRSKWDYDLGNGFYDYEANAWISGWGNNELEYYTRDPENAFVKD